MMNQHIDTEPLSDLDDFIALSELLRRGGDIGNRASYVLNMFCQNNEQDTAATKSNKRNPEKVCGLDPTRPATSVPRRPRFMRRRN